MKINFYSNKILSISLSKLINAWHQLTSVDTVLRLRMYGMMYILSHRGTVLNLFLPSVISCDTRKG